MPSGQTMAVAPGRPGVGSVRTPVKFGGPPLGGTEKSTVILFLSLIHISEPTRPY